MRLHQAQGARLVGKLSKLSNGARFGKRYASSNASQGPSGPSLGTLTGVAVVLNVGGLGFMADQCDKNVALDKTVSDIPVLSSGVGLAKTVLKSVKFSSSNNNIAPGVVETPRAKALEKPFKEMIEEKMTRQQIAEGQRLSREWFNEHQ